VWVFGGSGGLKNTKDTKRTQWFIVVQAIRALHPTADDPCIQEHPKSGNKECKRFGRGSLGANPRVVGGEVSSSSERKETMEGMSFRYSFWGGSALGA
jgi:hypothetical protein